MLPSVVAGVASGLALIVAIGAQNAFVLRQGIRREHVWAVVLVCALSDVVLIGAGVAGLGALIAEVPMVLSVMRWAGVGYLLWLGVQSWRAAAKPAALTVEREERTVGVTWQRSAIAALGLTYLNPHVYLDTVILLGNLANQHGSLRWHFAVGAMTASIVWFVSLGFGAAKLAPVFASARAWQVLDVVVGKTMFVFAALLAFQVW